MDALKQDEQAEASPDPERRDLLKFLFAGAGALVADKIAPAFAWAEEHPRALLGGDILETGDGATVAIYGTEDMVRFMDTLRGSADPNKLDELKALKSKNKFVINASEYPGVMDFPSEGEGILKDLGFKKIVIIRTEILELDAEKITSTRDLQMAREKGERAGAINSLGSGGAGTIIGGVLGYAVGRKLEKNFREEGPGDGEIQKMEDGAAVTIYGDEGMTIFIDTLRDPSKQKELKMMESKDRFLIDASGYAGVIKFSSEVKRILTDLGFKKIEIVLIQPYEQNELDGSGATPPEESAPKPEPQPVGETFPKIVGENDDEADLSIRSGPAVVFPGDAQTSVVTGPEVLDLEKMRVGGDELNQALIGVTPDETPEFLFPEDPTTNKASAKEEPTMENKTPASPSKIKAYLKLLAIVNGLIGEICNNGCTLADLKATKEWQELERVDNKEVMGALIGIFTSKKEKPKITPPTEYFEQQLNILHKSAEEIQKAIVSALDVHKERIKRER